VREGLWIDGTTNGGLLVGNTVEDGILVSAFLDINIFDDLTRVLEISINE
jgi:hypothetical protein